MKKYFLAMSCIILTLAVLFTTLYGCSKSNNNEENQLSGNYQVQIPEKVNIPDDALNAFASATKNLYGGKYSIVSYLGSQDIKGTNYYFLCEITPVTADENANPVVEFVIIYCDTDGNCTISKQHEIDTLIHTDINDIKQYYIAGSYSCIYN